MPNGKKKPLVHSVSQQYAIIISSLTFGGAERREMRFVIYGQFYKEKTLPSLNDYLQEIGRNPKAGNRMKQDYMNIVVNSVRKGLARQKVEKYPCVIHYRFYEPNKRLRDVGNVAALADKFIEDALVKCGVLEDDSPKYVENIDFEFHYISGTPYIEVEIEEVGK